MSDIPANTGNEESSTSNKQSTSEEHVKNDESTGHLEESATKIANAWRYHRKTREEEGKILSANSRDMIIKSNSSCLHLPGQTCPVWSQWEELLNAVEEHLRRKELREEPPSTMSKVYSISMTFSFYYLIVSIFKGLVLSRITSGSSWTQNTGWKYGDEKHRYGSNLKVYHDYWLKTSSPENFFEWLDNGSERAEHEVIFKDGLLIYAQSGKPVHTNPPDPDSVAPADSTQNLSIPNTTEPRSLSPAPSSQGSLNDEIEDPTSTEPTRRESTEIGPRREKWIYVTDCSGKFYVGQKKKGHFHHSSFLAGGAICAAGGIKVREGKLLEINPNSGHYKPAQHHFKALVERLVGEGIDITMFSMVYEELMRDASNTINQKIDFMDRHVSIFRRNVTETINSCKESIKDWIRRIMPGDDDMAENHIPDNDQQNGLH
ncbi:unnamed protein product [Rhizophagus irregularis]|nr:unnamed protein product [Rhizophagus irregularis]